MVKNNIEQHLSVQESGESLSLSVWDGRASSIAKENDKKSAAAKAAKKGTLAGRDAFEQFSALAMQNPEEAKKILPPTDKKGNVILYHFLAEDAADGNNMPSVVWYEDKFRPWWNRRYSSWESYDRVVLLG